MSAPRVSHTERFWDDRARRAGDDDLSAVCLDTREENVCIDRTQRALARAALDRLGRMRDLVGTTVLDYGCGTGRWIDFLRGYGCRYTGVDVSGAMLTSARRRYPDAELYKCDGEAIPCRDRSFEMVWSIAVVHHNPPDRQERLLAEFARVLRDRGVLVLLEGVVHRGRVPAAVYYPRTRPGWTALAQRHGFACRWRRGATYFLFRALAEALGQQHGLINAAIMAPPPGDAAKPAWIRWSAAIDSVLCPRLAGLLPTPLQRRVVMVFEKFTGP